MATPLKVYGGRDVVAAGVSIRNAGDGLSEAMNVEPTEMPIDQTVHVVLECTVTRHTYEELKDSDDLKLVHVLKAGRATIVESDIVDHHLDEQQRRIEEAEGVQRLFDEDGEGEVREGEMTPVGSALDEALGAAEAAEGEGGEDE